MELRNRIAAQFDKMKEGLLVFAMLIGFGFFINQGVELKGLYMDDLYLWSCYGEQTFREFVFPMGSTRFRFVFYLAAWLEMFILDGQVAYMVPFNIVLNAAIAYSIYAISVKMSGGRKLVSILAAGAYLLSRFSYYQIGQFYGLMESLGLWAALGMVYYVWRYANERKTYTYLLANLLYFMASFIHERYMVLVPVLLLGLLFAPSPMFMKKTARRAAAAVPAENKEIQESVVPAEETAVPEVRDAHPEAEEESRKRSRAQSQNSAVRRSRGQSRSRVNAGREERMGYTGRSAAGKGFTGKAAAAGVPKWILLLITAGLFAVIQWIRFITIGTLSPAGTGGTDVADTFVMADAIANAWSQVAFVFGYNSGPDYLCIMPYEDTPAEIQELIYQSNVILGISIAVFAVGCVLEAVKDYRKLFGHLKTILIFLAFIALCIGSSSVTIRVEMRWIYVVYAAALVLLAYMSKVMGKAAILIPVYVVLMFQTETFYRDHWDTLYLWPNQLRYNSLAEETIGKYGDDIFNKQVYIIGNDYEMSDFTAETFLKVYDREGDAKNTTIRFIDSDLDFKTISDRAVILWEDKENNAYKDVTEFVKHQRLNYAYGSYPDGWVDEHAKIVMMNGNTDMLKLGCYYPGTITGDQVCQIKVNGKRMPDLVFTDNYMTYEIPSAPYQMISLEFSCNFYVANAKEKRGEENLAMVVTLGAK